jgi:serine/threonine protein phosphatase PrpC
MPEDEFIILGCDGIWDCLSNEGAVNYVRTRIDSLSPAEIGVEMLNEILSADPRVTQGIGGDNMTIMIVDLQPHGRSYRSNPSPTSSVMTVTSHGDPAADFHNTNQNDPNVNLSSSTMDSAVDPAAIDID